MDQNIVRCQQTSEKRCDADDGGGEIPMVPYEFLPEFCYTCGIKGHTDKVLTSSYQWGRSNLSARNYVSS
jgi:hypothetical protein